MGILFEQVLFYNFASAKDNMEFLFGKKKTTQQMLRENQRSLNRVIRDLDRERTRMEQQQKKIVIDIKKMAKDGQMDAVKVMAKDLVRSKQYVKKMIMMKANIQAVSLKITTLKSQDAMMQAMKGVTKAMAQMNNRMKMPQLQKIMMDFERQSEMLDMKTEMMDDAVDDAMAGSDDEEESEAIVKEVLDELGLQMNEELGTLAPAVGGLAGPSTDTNKQSDASADADLEARLNNLRRDSSILGCFVC